MSNIQLRMFRTLTQEEEKEYRQWAHDNYVPHTEISGVWHPVVQDECVKINKESGEKEHVVSL